PRARCRRARGGDRRAAAALSAALRAVLGGVLRGVRRARPAARLLVRLGPRPRAAAGGADRRPRVPRPGGGRDPPTARLAALRATGERARDGGGDPRDRGRGARARGGARPARGPSALGRGRAQPAARRSWVSRASSGFEPFAWP